jgi:UDP:flavonoid glycosyltransferase YjiC (YdhE family)
MRILFTTWAWPTHYYPMVPLAWALRAAGHDVRMTSQPAALAAMRASGLPATAIGTDVDVGATFRTASEQVRRGERQPDPFAAGPPPGRGDRFTDRLAGLVDTPALAESYALLRELEEEAIQLHRALWLTSPSPRPWRLSLYGEVAEAMVGDLLAFARSWRPDLIVYDALTFAGPLAAKLLDIPAVRSLFGPDVTYFINAKSIAAVLDRLGLDEVDLLGAATVDPCPASLQYCDALAPARRIRTRYVPYGGLAEVAPWLTEPPARPRICLTWGTSIHRLLGDRAFVSSEVLLGAAKLADERGAELVLAITAGQRRLLPDLLPANVRVVESVPLDALLPTCQALIHQGGAGTMLTGLRHGLPQLVLTQLFDEAANAFQLVAAGAGQTRHARLTSAELLAAGRDLLDDPAYRLAAQALRQEILDLPAPAEVVDKLVELSTA